MEHHQKQLNTELKSIQSAMKSMILAIQKNYNTHKKVLELRKTTRQAVAEAEVKSAEVEDIKKQMAELQAENSRLTGLVSSAEAERQKAAIALKDKYLHELVKLERKRDAEISQVKESAKEAGKQGFKKVEDVYAKQCNAAKELFFNFFGWIILLLQLLHRGEKRRLKRESKEKRGGREGREEDDLDLNDEDQLKKSRSTVYLLDLNKICRKTTMQSKQIKKKKKEEEEEDGATRFF
ncbi:meiosis-specific nuclear structural protein 1-like [Camellia sinensis]|uniref:meiosis-specific nuclear structural protein 1-like n=1 Tax=Camellia sinensis TaxID=4442 RepID=UPI001036B920|nr:meiosis-specific nuclear structural protein 1-like [Camellia sinensis]